MNCTQRFVIASVALGAALAGTSGFAHDLVLIPTTDASNASLTIKFGHPADFHLPETNRLVELTAYGPSGASVSLWNTIRPLNKEDLTVSIPGFSASGGLWVIAGRYDNGYWVEGPNHVFFNTTRREMPDSKGGGHFTRVGKTLLLNGSAQGYDRVVGHRLEIVPLANPFALKVGETLAVRVLWEGKPLAGAKVEDFDNMKFLKEEDIPRFATDAEGVAKLPITRKGYQFFAVDYAVPAVHPDLGEKDAYSATLTFVLP